MILFISLIFIVLVTLLVIGIQKSRKKSVMLPSLALVVVLGAGFFLLLQYIQMILLVALALIGLLLALRAKGRVDRDR